MRKINIVDAVFDTAPDFSRFGDNPEPSIRKIIHGYYNRNFPSIMADDLTSEYIDALLAALEESV